MIEVASNMLCTILEVYNPWRVLVKHIISQQELVVHLREGFMLHSGLVGESIYFCGIRGQGAIVNATCYQRDILGCIEFVKPLENTACE